MLKFVILFITILPLHAASIKEEIVSPVTTKAAPWFWTGTGLTVAFIITEDVVSDPATKETSDHKPLGDLSRFGDIYGQVWPNAIYALGMLAHGKFAGEKVSYSRAEHMTKATLYAGAVATLLKYTVREPRPDHSAEKNSFPSGHTTTAFAFASVIAVQHKWYWGTLALAMASLTAYSRMNDGRHFLHDVVGGMTIGASYGLGLYYAQKEGAENISFAPILDQNKTGLRVVRAF